MTLRIAVRSVLVPLAAILANAEAQGQDATATVPDAATLEREFVQARDAWNKEFRKASKDKDSKARTSLLKNRPASQFVPRFQAGAKANVGTANAVPYLSWLISNDRGEVARASIQILIKSHVTHPGIRRAVARIGGLRRSIGVEQSRNWLDAVLAKNPHPEVQAQARYTRAAAYVGTRAVERSEQLRQLAIDDLNKVIEASDGQSLKGLAQRLLFEAENLEPGLAAPDIHGEDLDGIKFKLSDYRGKVVLLDFWGDW
jgi:hypothetical protein